MEKRDLRCIILDLFTRRSSPCLLLMTISTKQFRRSARDLEGGDACWWTGRKRELRSKEPVYATPYIEPSWWDIVTFVEIYWWSSFYYQQWTAKRSGTMPLFPNGSRQRHKSFYGLISRTDPHPNLETSSQIWFQIHITKCTNLSSWEFRIPLLLIRGSFTE